MSKHYLICSKVGFKIAKSLAHKGAKISMYGAIDTFTKVDTICNQTKGVSCLPYLCNINHQNEITHTLKEVVDTFGSIDGVVVDMTCLSRVNNSLFFGETCLGYMKDRGSILLAPPVRRDIDQWLIHNMEYRISRYNMEYRKTKYIDVTTLSTIKPT